MSCPLCKSEKQETFTAEINLHFDGLKNIDHPGVLLFPKIQLCLDCGFSRFTTPKTELTLLAAGISQSAVFNQQRAQGLRPLRRLDPEIW